LSAQPGSPGVAGVNGIVVAQADEEEDPVEEAFEQSRALDEIFQGKTLSFRTEAWT